MTKSLNHNFFNDDRVREELDALETYYQRNFRLFCEALDITPAQLRDTDPLKLLTVMLMRAYGQLEGRIDTLERRMTHESSRPPATSSFEHGNRNRNPGSSS